MQYRALRHARINGHDYAPGELIQDPGAIRNPRTLISARYIVPADDGAAPEAAEPLEPVQQMEEEAVTGHLDADELGKMRRAELEALAVDLGVADAADKAVYPNIDSLVAKLVTIPVDVSADEDAAPAGDEPS